MMAAAKVDPFQLAEMRRNLRLHLFPCPLQCIETLFAEIMKVDSRQMLEMAELQLADREPQPAVGLTGVIFFCFTERYLGINS